MTPPQETFNDKSCLNHEQLFHLLKTLPEQAASLTTTPVPESDGSKNRAEEQEGEVEHLGAGELLDVHVSGNIISFKKLPSLFRLHIKTRHGLSP